MQDYEYLFSKQLHEKLKDKVKGKVWVKIYHDELHVKITNYNEVSKYEFVMNNLSNNILNGLSSEYLVYAILKDYKIHVNKLYFK